MLKRFILAPIAILAVASVLAGGRASIAAPEPIRVLVWDEQQPAQKEAYDNFLGNAVADFLRARGDGKNGRPIVVKSVNLNEPEQGLGGDILDKTDVLIWWGHQRHAEVKMETVGKAVAERVKAGKLNLIALHSAHFATPFFAVMNERTTDDALKTLTKAERESPAQVRATAAPALREDRAAHAFLDEERQGGRFRRVGDQAAVLRVLGGPQRRQAEPPHHRG